MKPTFSLFLSKTSLARKQAPARPPARQSTSTVASASVRPRAISRNFGVVFLVPLLLAIPPVGLRNPPPVGPDLRRRLRLPKSNFSLRNPPTHRSRPSLSPPLTQEQFLVTLASSSSFPVTRCSAHRSEKPASPPVSTSAVASARPRAISCNFGVIFLVPCHSLFWVTKSAAPSPLPIDSHRHAIRFAFTQRIPGCAKLALCKELSSALVGDVLIRRLRRRSPRPSESPIGIFPPGSPPSWPSCL
ncbi:hypothetical protein NL676_000087 [Syzygium grande]|nr:hypothetical protein NL676_000087 [Syzygium grande]